MRTNLTRKPEGRSSQAATQAVIDPAPGSETPLEQLPGVSSGSERWEGSQVITGHLAGIDDEGRLLFSPEGDAGNPVPVAIGVALSDGVLVRAARRGQRALVVKTSEAPAQMVLIGVMRERVGATARDAAPGQLEVQVDGETLRLTAEREIELRCGNASLVLRQSGRIVLRGTYVVTSSRGPLKIKGATVEIN